MKHKTIAILIQVEELQKDSFFHFLANDLSNIANRTCIKRGVLSFRSAHPVLLNGGVVQNLKLLLPNEVLPPKKPKA